MRRAVLATAGTSAVIVTLLAVKPHRMPAVALPAPADGESGRPHTPAAGSSGAPTGTGTFTGDPVATQYGTVQVAVVLAKGKITTVRVLQAPHDNGHSREITSFAVPRLKQETISAQSAHIDAVSGASYTSPGYVQSLQSALDRAHG